MKTLGIINSVLVVLCATLLNANAQSSNPCKQITRIGVSINQMVTGSSHGSLSYVRMTYGSGRCNVGVGAIMQNNYNKVTGLGAEYNYTAIKGEYNVDLYFNASVNYFHQTQKSINYTMATHTPEFAENVQAGLMEYEKYNTLEAYASFGILIKVVQNLRIDAAIGFGGHYSDLQNTDYRNSWSVFKQDYSCGLMLKAGLAYTIDFYK